MTEFWVFEALYYLGRWSADFKLVKYPDYFNTLLNCSGCVVQIVSYHSNGFCWSFCSRYPLHLENDQGIFIEYNSIHFVFLYVVMINIYN